VDDIVDSAHRLLQAFGVAHVADEVPHAGCVERLLHFELLELVAREYDDARRLALGKQRFDELLAERPRSAGDEYRFVVEHCPILPGQAAHG